MLLIDRADARLPWAAGYRRPAAAGRRVMSLNKVDLPTPLRPTRPTLAPAGIATLAPSKKRRPQASKTRFSIRSMPGFQAPPKWWGMMRPLLIVRRAKWRGETVITPDRRHRRFLRAAFQAPAIGSPLPRSCAAARRAPRSLVRSRHGRAHRTRALRASSAARWLRFAGSRWFPAAFRGRACP